MTSRASEDAATLLPLPATVFHVLVALAGDDLHGYAIMQDVSDRTGVRLSPGALYTAIPRMLEQGLVTELRRPPDPAARDDARRRYYRLTPFGRAVARAEANRLADLVQHARAQGLAQ